jgi:hypothetical protein
VPQWLQPWRHEAIENSHWRYSLVPGLARKHEGRLHVERPKGRASLLGSRA